jgi:hypothetical protein
MYVITVLSYGFRHRCFLLAWLSPCGHQRVTPNPKHPFSGNRGDGRSWGQIAQRLDVVEDWQEVQVVDVEEGCC